MTVQRLLISTWPTQFDGAWVVGEDLGRMSRCRGHVGWYSPPNATLEISLSSVIREKILAHPSRHCGDKDSNRASQVRELPLCLVDVRS